MPWQPIFTLACIRVAYISKFIARHENLFYRKYSLEKKQKRLINNVKRETDICLRTHFDNKITPRLSQKLRRPRAPMLCRIKIGIKSTLNQKADSYRYQKEVNLILS